MTLRPRPLPSLRLLPLALLLIAQSACSEAPDDACAPGESMVNGACMNLDARYEPAERVDTNNVVAFGDPLKTLVLPDPPKRGFRLVAAPRLLQPGEEIETCMSWPFPANQSSNIIYSGHVYATPGLHHSNVVTRPIDKETGPQPYPECYPGAYDPFGDLPDTIADVLFASSTQVNGGETLALPPGIGFRVDMTREIVTNIHFLNTTSEPIMAEVAYDLFTMPEELLDYEAAPFVMQVNDFLIPPHSKQTIGGTCDVYGGSVVSMMPHTHKLLEHVSVDVIHASGEETRVYEKGAFDTASDIRVYTDPIGLKSTDSIRYACDFNNTTDHDVVYGIGENEMCILFGYIYPVSKQLVAYSEFQGDPCTSFQIGLAHP